MISIIVPIYNVAKYLKKCLTSIQNQTFTDFEVLMINDGSTDNSQSIASNFTSDQRFKLINKRNGGQSSARNIGLDRCIGEYICFIDSDDFVEPSFLENLYTLLIKEDADIAQCGVNRITEEGRIVPYSYTGLKDSVYTDIHSYIMSSSFVIWNKIYKKELFNGMKFFEGIKFEDYCLAPQIYSRAKKIVSTKDILYNYLWRKESTVNSSQIQYDILKAHKILDNSEFGKSNPTIMSHFFIRQVVGYLIWGIIRYKAHYEDAKEITIWGLNRYPLLYQNVYDEKLPKSKIIWAKILLNKHFKVAQLYSRSYYSFYKIYKVSRKYFSKILSK